MLSRARNQTRTPSFLCLNVSLDPDANHIKCNTRPPADNEKPVYDHATTTRPPEGRIGILSPTARRPKAERRSATRGGRAEACLFEPAATSTSSQPAAAHRAEFRGAVVWTFRVSVLVHRYGTSESGSAKGVHYTSPAQRDGSSDGEAKALKARCISIPIITLVEFGPMPWRQQPECFLE